MQEKGQRIHTKHINNFSELLFTNIRRSTSYNSIKHTSIIKIINFHSNIDKIQKKKARNVVLLLLQNPSTNKEKFRLSSGNNPHFTSIQHFHL